jgi:tetratricopeptide (TPR) repeat protein
MNLMYYLILIRNRQEPLFFLRDLLDTHPTRLNAIFVLGRNVDELTNIALSLFKKTPKKQISLLNREETIKLVRLSEDNETLRWLNEAIEQIYQLTGGHPFLTQLMCSRIWDRLYNQENSPVEVPKVRLEDVKAVITDTLKASSNIFEWLWSGLPSAERVIASALSTAETELMTDTQLEGRLYQSGVQLVIRDLQNAPRRLKDLDLIESVADGYRFKVELLRQWVFEHKPLNLVQNDLDRVQSTADIYYQASLRNYYRGLLDTALGDLHRAMMSNPNHVGANQLRACIFFDKGKLNDAREILEKLSEYEPDIAHPLLIKVLLTLAKNNHNEEEKIKLYKQVLELDSNNSNAKEEYQEIWQRRGEEAYQNGDLETALKCYQISNLDGKREDKISQIKQEIEQQNTLADWYQRAKGALQEDDQKTAQRLLADIILEVQRIDGFNGLIFQSGCRSTSIEMRTEVNHNIFTLSPFSREQSISMKNQLMPKQVAICT